MASIVYSLKDVTCYRQVDGKDLWFVAFEHEPERGYSWQRTSVLGNISPDLKMKMAQLKRQWKLKHYIFNKIHQFLYFILCIVSMVVVVYIVNQQGVFDIFANPHKDHILTLPLSLWVFIAFITLCTIGYWLLDRKKMSKYSSHYSLSHKKSSTHSFREEKLKSLPKPTRIQPERACRKSPRGA